MCRSCGINMDGRDVELVPLKSALVNNNSNTNNNGAYLNGVSLQNGGTAVNNNAGSSFLNPSANHPSSSSLFDYQFLSKRSTASKRLLHQTSSNQFKNEEFSMPPMGPLPGACAPSRKREEREALQNLRKRVPPHDLPNPPEELVTKKPPQKERQENSGPSLLQRILSHRPMSIVVELNEAQTAWQDSDFITECLCWHNVYRQRHGAPALSMSPDLCGYAQNWANHLAHTNKFYYRSDREVGQNLFQRPVNTLQADVTGQEVSSYWYAAVRQYDYFKETDVLHANVNAGHFTQVVWVSTRLFGVGKARSRAGKIIVVAHYSPPGNLSGAFEMNVLPPIPEYNLPGALEFDFDNPHLIRTHKDPSDSTGSTMSSGH